MDLAALDTHLITADAVSSSIDALPISDIEREVMPGA
jgi:hypothetical protein